MIVYTLPDGEVPLVATFATWFELLANELAEPIDVPPETQLELIETYEELGDGFDAVDAYTLLTGCAQLPVDQMLIEGRILGPGVTSCVEDYTAALDAAGNGPYDGESTTMCFAEFRSKYGGELNAAAIRAVLDRCQDVSPLNTAAGIGYNRNENPLVCAPLVEQTVTERYTGPEFILLNRPLSGLPSTAEIVIEVPDGPYDFLTEGYC